jgi:deoxycytidine triphosphate deaminase/large-conductance mechanosensitive channel
MSNNDQRSEEKKKQMELDDKYAARKYEEFKLKDPFPDIPPALLNWADIKKYVDKTGMICPFHPEPEKKNLKQASYAVRLLGRCIYWDEKGEKKDSIIDEKDEFPLKRNSIAFVSLEPRFRIPYYIALRFNLKITHIQRGVLLGTGPLVDPGFDGKLCVPLHNLTNNDYVLRGGDDLIWVEFTKIHADYHLRDKEEFGKEKPSIIKDFVEFRSDKNIIDVNDYLHKAFQGNPIRSSLSEIYQVAERAERNTKILKYGGIIAGIISIIALVAAIVLPILGLISDSTNYVKEAKKDFMEQQLQQTKEMEELKGEIKSLKSLINNLQVNRTGKSLESNIPTKVRPPQDGTTKK